MVSHELWHISPAKTEILITDHDTSIPGRVLIKSLYSLVSIGTERIVSKGLVPPKLFALMQVPHMGGSFKMPVKYGYSLVGEVIAGPTDCMGKKVHLMHPHQDIVFASPEEVSVIPEGIPDRRAVLASVMETAVNAVWDSEVSIGDLVLVNGFGLIGALIALLASQIPGVRVHVCEPNTERNHLAEKLGFILCDGNINTLYDVAFNATARGEGLQYCIDNTDYEGTIVEVSWFGNGKIELDLGGSFHIRRQRIIASQVSKIPKEKVNNWDFKGRKDLVFKLLENPDFDALLTSPIPFSEAPAVFDRIRNESMNEISVTFRY